MLMCGVIGSAFAVSRALSRGAGLGRAAYLIAAWGALAAALAAPVALPAAAQLARSTRAAGLSRYELTRFSVSPRRLPGLFVPRAFDDTPELSSSLEESRDISPFEEYFDSAPFASSIYLGSGALLLALFAIRAGRRGRIAQAELLHAVHLRHHAGAVQPRDEVLGFVRGRCNERFVRAGASRDEKRDDQRQGCWQDHSEPAAAHIHIHEPLGWAAANRAPHKRKNEQGSLTTPDFMRSADQAHDIIELEATERCARR